MVGGGILFDLWCHNSFSSVDMILTAPDLPETMKAVLASDYGDIDVVLSLEDGVPVPSLKDLSEKEQATHMVIRNHAVALAPGDCRVLSGKTRELQGPPSMPYTPGGDCAGTVVQTTEGARFALGDQVAVRFLEGPRGALAEYALVSTKVADKRDSLDAVVGACLAGASPATLLADRIEEGERVLVLGASGGVGSHFGQLVQGKASLLVGVSSNPDRLQSLGYDRAIDYTKEDVFALKEYQDEPFDVIVDLASGGWPQCLDAADSGPLIVKPASSGGRYLATTLDTAYYEIHSYWQMLMVFAFPLLWKAFVSRTLYRSKLPKFSFCLNLPDTHEVVTDMLEHHREGRLRPIYQTYDFTTDGIREAFRVQESRHTPGKVVIPIP